mgnify:CR=1 FL=1
MSSPKQMDHIKGLFGTLAVYKDPTKDTALYVGPIDFLESKLFQDCIEFRAQFHVTKVISNTIFTACQAYRLAPENIMPRYLSGFSTEDSILEEIVSVGERALNWEHEKLRYIANVSAYHHVDPKYLDANLQTLSTCFFIRGVEQLMFDTAREVHMLEVRTRLGINDTGYNVRYYNLPIGIVSCSLPFGQ